MSLLIIASAAFFGAFISFFSGFGLGSILLPVFAIFFPPVSAVAAVAIVHGINNIFKAALMSSKISWPIFFRFGLPACLSAFIGAIFLNYISSLPVLMSYNIFHHRAEITVIKIVIATLIAAFTIIDLTLRSKIFILMEEHLTIGGFLSGFFGGLSGHQGALRSMFLSKSSMGPKAFIATSAIITTLVDLIRIPTYFLEIFSKDSPTATFFDENLDIILIAAAAALFGVALGVRMVEQVSMKNIKNLVGILLMLTATLLGLGII